jgi:hypothetical protein
MKTHILFLIAVIAISISGCKKNNNKTNNSETVKVLFSNTTWVGQLKYTSRPVAEPFRVRFNADGTFTWYELDGEYAGKYSVDPDTKMVSVNFNSGSKFTGTVTDNKELKSLTYGGSYVWAINNFEISREALPTLSNTNWKGSSNISPALAPRALNINFKISSSLDFVISGGSGGLITSCTGITFQERHLAIQFNCALVSFFGILKNGELTGIQREGTVFSNWKVSKL